MLRQEIKQTDRMSKESKKEETVREIISVKNLYKLYRVGDSVVRALDGVSFSVYEGAFCAIVGTSGSGKSTLLNIIKTDSRGSDRSGEAYRADERK